MDVFGIAVTESGDYLRAAVIAAGCDLGVFAALATPRTLGELAAALGVRPRRLGILVDVLAAIAALERRGDRLVARAVPARPDVAPDGWGRCAEVIRRDRPLAVAGGDAERRFHQHLARAGSAAADELFARHGDGVDAGVTGDAAGRSLEGRRGAGAARDDADRSRLDGRRGAGVARDAAARSHLAVGGGAASGVDVSLLDIGGGAGAYTRAFLVAYPAARATLVDFEDVLALAREELGPLAARVTFVAGDARVAAVGEGHDIALLANVLHLHGPDVARGLVAAAARAVAPGGLVAIKDLEVAEDRSGPLAGLLFALNMALYTGEGDVYPASQLRAWLSDAGLVDVAEHRLAAAPDAIVVTGRRRDC